MKHTTEKKNVERYSDAVSWSETEVLNHYQGWIQSLVSSATVNLTPIIWRGLAVTREDMIQEATIALLSCWRTYQTERVNFPFIPYSYKRVRGSIVDSFRTYRIKNKNPPPLFVTYDEEIYHPFYVERLNDTIDLSRAIKLLDKWERRFINLIYVEGDTLKTIGKMAGVTESRASQVHSVILGKLRTAMDV